jgi:membrane-bound lytic murein transglycosylase D
MEKRFPMNLRHILLLCSALWLTGCATTTPTDGTAPPAPRRSPAIFPKVRSAHWQQERPRRKVASLTPPADLWERIRNGFAMPDLEQDLVQNQEQWYASRPDYIQRMTSAPANTCSTSSRSWSAATCPPSWRCCPYRKRLQPAGRVQRQGRRHVAVHARHGHLFRPQAERFRDDRRDVLASTRAALDYLQKLYNMFGDWHLALAAYNWGEGSVGRAIKRNQKLGLPTGYTDLNMPAETRNYVPKLQAVKNIVAQPGRFNAELPLIENHPISRPWTSPATSTWSWWPSWPTCAKKTSARSTQLSQAGDPGAGTPQILLPWDNAKVFRRNLQAYTKASLPAGRYGPCHAP